MPNEIKRLNPTANSFMANGRKYLIHDALTLKRFEVFERLQLEVSMGIDFQSVAKTISEAYTNLQTLKVADAGVLLHNLLGGISRKLQSRENPVLLLCTLFMCREGENLAEWNETEAAEKIDDWRKEGISTGDFFSVAFSSIKGFTEVLNNGLDSTLTTQTTTTEEGTPPLDTTPN